MKILILITLVITFLLFACMALCGIVRDIGKRQGVCK